MAPLGADKPKVLTLNLRNPLIFRCADEADAVQAADFLGKKRVLKRSWGSSAGKRTVNYSETEEHKSSHANFAYSATMNACWCIATTAFAA